MRIGGGRGGGEGCCPLLARYEMRSWVRAGATINYLTSISAAPQTPPPSPPPLPPHHATAPRSRSLLLSILLWHVFVAFAIDHCSYHHLKYSYRGRNSVAHFCTVSTPCYGTLRAWAPPTEVGLKEKLPRK